MDLKEFGTKALGLLFGLAVVYVLVWWGMSAQKNRNDENPWRGTFSKRQVDSFAITDSEEFKTLELCRSWARNKAASLSLKDEEWKFECGTGCKWKDDSIIGGKRVNTYECSEVVSD